MKIRAVLMTILTCAGCCFGGPVSGASLAADTSPPMHVDACAVEGAYRANELSAQQQYPSGRRMVVSGTVDRVSQNFGRTAVHPRPCMFTALYLTTGQEAGAAALRQGEPFRAECVMGSYMIGAQFEGCSLAPH